MNSYAQDLATREAQRQGCQLDIVLATVEAETGGTNEVGDSGNALGYGQVWPKWHMNAFRAIGAQLSVDVPSDLPSLTARVLANDQFSMGVAVYVIKANWEAAKGDWAQFTYSYVGPHIPASDFQRRQKIWVQYHNGSYDQSDMGSLGQPGFPTLRDGISIPQTNYQVTPGSVTVRDILYGRRYRVLVTDQKGETALDVSKLHCVFTCVKTIFIEPIYSTIAMFNLSPQNENALIEEGHRVILEAGYEGSQYGQIFDGLVTMPIREKQNGTDFKLSLIAMDSDTFTQYGTSAFSMVRGQNSRAIIERIASTASIPTQLGNISGTLSSARLTRGKVIFGKSSDILRQIAHSENAYVYTENGKVNLIKLDDYPDGEVINLTPESGLIGVPTQKDYGVTVKMLMNPRVKLGSLIHIDNSLVRNQQFQVGQPIRTLDQDGIYRVIQITYSGDTRGTDWYTEVETVGQAGAVPDLMQTPSSSMN